MNKKEIFEVLVRNGNQDGLDEYYTHEFSFETVFSIYSYSYCCCPCAFEHEYLDYLSDDGVNESMFERIKENIARRRCEHVDGVLSQYVHETRVTGQHIVAASGVLPDKDDYQQIDTKMFNLYPYMMAVLKKHSLEVENFINHCYSLAKEQDSSVYLITNFLYARRFVERPEMIGLQVKQITEICAIQKDPLLFCILDLVSLEDFDKHLSNAFETLYRDKASDMLKRMSDFIRSRIWSSVRGSVVCSYGFCRCLQSIILYNEPEMLADCLCHYEGSTDDRWFLELKRLVTQTSCFFHREKCCEVLKRAHLFSDDVKCEDEDTVKEDLLDTATKSLIEYPDRLSATFATVIEKDPVVHDIIINKFRNGLMREKIALKSLFDIGFDMNSVEAGNPIDGILSDVLDPIQYYNSREALEMFIYENVDIDRNENSVAMAIQVVDKGIVNCELFTQGLEYWMDSMSIGDPDYSRSYVMNGLVQSPYRHEGGHFVLNFVAPLLLECGYPANHTLLHEALDKDLHDEELEYFRQYLSKPKSFKLSCCLALRSKFKGRAVHRFVEAANLPQTISDFILFKHVLKCI